MTGFFALGAVIANATGVAHRWPGAVLEPMWRFNPQAHTAFLGMGARAVALMATVATAGAFAAVGLSHRGAVATGRPLSPRVGLIRFHVDPGRSCSAGRWPVRGLSHRRRV